jgi:hypothetical protein
MARSESSQRDDLFGSAMNKTSKINSLAMPNGFVIGEALFSIVKELTEFTFTPAKSGSVPYTAYHVNAKAGMGVINPFEKKDER